MGFGDTAKKVQTVADTAEKLYTRINELRDQLQALRREVDETSEQVDRIEHEVESQRALLVALAEQGDIDVESVLADGAIEGAEPAGSTDGTEPTETAESAPANTVDHQAAEEAPDR